MKKFLKRLLIVLGILLAVWCLLYTLPRPQNYALENPMRRDGELPILIAHGGGHLEFPDNTLEAFYNAYSVDPRVMMETDVSITKDGVLILSHDTTLDRKTTVTGAIADWNYSDLMAQKVDFGYTNFLDETYQFTGERMHFTADDGQPRYPTDVEYPEGVEPRDDTVFLATTLEELLTAFPENRINVEIKQDGELGIQALREALRLLEKYDAFGRVVLASFHNDVYAEFQRLQADGEVPDCFMYSPAADAVTRFYVLQLLNADSFFPDGMCVFQLPTEEFGLSLSTRHLVDAAHRHNLAVHYWTIDDEDEMRRLIDIGADGIMTNYPHRLQAVYEAYQGD